MFACSNPCCPRRKGQRFETEKGLMLHLRKSPICMEVFNRSRNGCNKRLKTANTTAVVSEFIDPSIQRNRQNPFYPIFEEQGIPANDESGSTNDSDIKQIVDMGNDGQPENETNINDGFSTYTKEQRYMCQLIWLLDSFGAPDYAVERIIEWAQDARRDGWDFNPKTKSRHGNIKWMYDTITNANHLLPKVQLVKHNYGPPFECIVYDFVPQLLSLLQNETLMSPENLVLDWNNPTVKYQPTNGMIGEANSGSVYQNLYD